MAARTKGNPLCPSTDSRLFAASMMTIRLFAGPLIAICDPLMKVVTIPPIIAAIKPDMGGLPEAMAIPNANGKATRDTLIAASKSCFQYFL